jgi:hypothetical protein
MEKSIVSMVDSMKNIVGNLKLINVKMMNIDVEMDNVFHNHFIEINLSIFIVLMALTKYFSPFDTNVVKVNHPLYVRT